MGVAGITTNLQPIGVGGLTPNFQRSSVVHDGLAFGAGVDYQWQTGSLGCCRYWVLGADWVRVNLKEKDSRECKHKARFAGSRHLPHTGRLQVWSDLIRRAQVYPARAQWAEGICAANAARSGESPFLLIATLIAALGIGSLSGQFAGHC